MPAPVVIAPPKPLATAPAGCEQYRPILSKYDWNVSVMMAIMQAESGCRAGSTGDGHLTYKHAGRTYGYSVSLLQVRILPGRERCDTHDPATNIDCAHGIWKGQGYRAWSVYKSGKYLAYLNK